MGCAGRESNPGYELGKLMCFHYTTGACNHARPWAHFNVAFRFSREHHSGSSGRAVRGFATLELRDVLGAGPSGPDQSQRSSGGTDRLFRTRPTAIRKDD